MRRRAARAGFTLLESLIAFAILASVLGVVYAVIAQMLARQDRVATDLEMARLGRAVLVEYVVTWPAMAGQGQLGDRYGWRVEEVPLPSEGEVERDLGLRYVRLDVTVSDLRRRWPDLQLSTAMTQPRP